MLADRWPGAPHAPPVEIPWQPLPFAGRGRVSAPAFPPGVPGGGRYVGQRVTPDSRPMPAPPHHYHADVVSRSPDYLSR